MTVAETVVMLPPAVTVAEALAASRMLAVNPPAAMAWATASADSASPTVSDPPAAAAAWAMATSCAASPTSEAPADAATMAAPESLICVVSEALAPAVP